MIGPDSGSAAFCASPGLAPMNEKHSGKKTISQPLETASATSVEHVAKLAAASLTEVICTRPARTTLRARLAAISV